jgi:hypothetical protein
MDMWTLPCTGCTAWLGTPIYNPSAGVYARRYYKSILIAIRIMTLWWSRYTIVFTPIHLYGIFICTENLILFFIEEHTPLSGSGISIFLIVVKILLVDFRTISLYKDVIFILTLRCTLKNHKYECRTSNCFHFDDYVICRR